ncbi:MAG: hypothetical protein AB1847_16830 [bacterium]
MPRLVPLPEIVPSWGEITARAAAAGGRAKGGSRRQQPEGGPKVADGGSSKIQQPEGADAGSGQS